MKSCKYGVNKHQESPCWRNCQDNTVFVLFGDPQNAFPGPAFIPCTNSGHPKSTIMSLSVPRDLQELSSFCFCRSQQCLRKTSFPSLARHLHRNSARECPPSAGKTPATCSLILSRSYPTRHQDMRDTKGCTTLARPLVAKAAMLLPSETCSSSACAPRFLSYSTRQI